MDGGTGVLNLRVGGKRVFAEGVDLAGIPREPPLVPSTPPAFHSYVTFDYGVTKHVAFFILLSEMLFLKSGLYF